jgi:uncharacterized membrane protein YozB (DUF420 family)
MTGLLGTNAGIEADLNLLLHIIILGLIIAGFTFARRKKFTIHEKWMFTAIVLVAGSFFAWMAPSYVGSFQGNITQLSSPAAIVTNIHVTLGTITGILAIYIILRMKFDLPQCFAVRKVRSLMRTAFTFWCLTFAFGVSVYIWYYVL